MATTLNPSKDKLVGDLKSLISDEEELLKLTADQQGGTVRYIRQCIGEAFNGLVDHEASGAPMTSTSFPACRPASIIRWASAASASGRQACISGRTRPAAISGHTTRRSSIAMAAFSMSGSGRNSEPVIRSDFAMIVRSGARQSPPSPGDRWTRRPWRARISTSQAV